MHIVARILAVAYVVLAGIAGVIYVQTSANYVSITEVRLNIEDDVVVSRVEVLWTGDPAQIPGVRVWFNATNPGKIVIEVTNMEFQLHMDDPLDPRFPYDPEKLMVTRIRPGGVSYARGNGIVIAPGQTASIPLIVLVEGPEQFARFNRTDAAGRFHPIVWGPRLAYTFVDFDFIPIRVLVSPYYDASGVLPSASDG